MRVAASILRQHAELAAILWAQRETLSGEDFTDTEAVAVATARLAAHLDALSIAGDAAWPVIMAQYEECPEPGELFVAAVHALAGGDAHRITQAVALARAAPGHDGLRGALAWLTPAALAPAVRSWLASDDGFRRHLAASAYLLHGADPGQRLAAFLDDADGRVRAQGYRLAGRLRRTDVVERVLAGLADTDPQARFWAAAACVEMGMAGPLEPLKAAVAVQSPHAVTALRWVLTALPTPEARRWLHELAASSATRVLAVRGIGMIGDRDALPWLVQCMGEAEVALPAAAAFLKIFGPVGELDDYFYADPDQAAQALGVDADTVQGRVPIRAMFAALIERSGPVQAGGG